MNPVIQTRVNNIRTNVVKQAPLIMTCLGIAGSVGAVWKAWKVAPKAVKVLKDIDENHDPEMTKGQILWEKTKAMAPFAGPVIVMEAVSIGCAIGSYSMNTKRLSTLAAAYALSERRFTDYQRKVVEQIGKNKEEKVRAEVAKEEVKKNPLGKSNEVVLLPGDTLCYDSMSGRYFKSDMEKLKSAENDLNKRLQTEMYISLNEFYYEIGLPEIEIGEELGWNIGEDLISLEFSSVIAENNQPCLVVNYRVGPRYDFRNLH